MGRNGTDRQAWLLKHSTYFLIEDVVRMPIEKPVVILNMQLFVLPSLELVARHHVINFQGKSYICAMVNSEANKIS